MEQRKSLFILASYDDKQKELHKGKHLRNHIKEIAVKELRRKGKFNNHHLWRNSSDMSDFLKSNFLLDGIPLIAYQLQASLESKLIGDVYVCSNKDAELVVDYFKKFNKKRIMEKEVDYVFINEGPPNEWKIEKSIEKCITEAKKKDYDSCIVTTGDVPFVNSFDLVAKRSLKERDIIYDLNSKEKIWGLAGDDANPGPHPRFFHWKIRIPNESGGEEVLSVKENQYFESKFDFLENISKIAYDARKSENGGWIGFFRKTVLTKEMGPYVVKYLMKNEPKLSYNLIDSLARLYLRGKYEDIKKRFGISTYRSGYEKIDTKLYIPKIETVNHLLQKALNIKGEVIVENTNPGFLEDVDSLEDLYDLELMLNRAPKKTDISVNHEALEEFRDYAMPKLKKKVNIYHDFNAYINWFCNKMGLDPFYWGDRINERLFSQFTDDMVEHGIKTHMRYNKENNLIP